MTKQRNLNSKLIGFIYSATIRSDFTVKNRFLVGGFGVFAYTIWPSLIIQSEFSTSNLARIKIQTENDWTGERRRGGGSGRRTSRSIRREIGQGKNGIVAGNVGVSNLGGAATPWCYFRYPNGRISSWFLCVELQAEYQKRFGS